MAYETPPDVQSGAVRTIADPARGQGRILAMLKIQPKIKTRELAYLLGIRQQSLNELLNKLEKSGHVERFSPDYDGFIPDRGPFGAFGGRPDK